LGRLILSLQKWHFFDRIFEYSKNENGYLQEFGDFGRAKIPQNQGSKLPIFQIFACV